MKKGFIVLLIVLGIGLWAASMLIGARNQLVRVNETVKVAWSQVENQMQRRADLIPNLVNTVKGFAQQEKEIFISVAEARAKLAGARTVPEKIQANEDVSSALARLLVVVENYPQLKSDANFIALQDELSGTENRIAVERKRYNEALQAYNLRVLQFPSNIAARVFGFAQKDAYFQAQETAKAVPKVEF